MRRQRRYICKPPCKTIDIRQQAAVMFCIAVAYRNKIYLKIGEIKMIGFIIGLFIGVFIGVCVMCLCNAASRADRYMDENKNEKR